MLQNSAYRIDQNCMVQSTLNCKKTIHWCCSLWLVLTTVHASYMIGLIYIVFKYQASLVPFVLCHYCGIHKWIYKNYIN